MHLRRHSMGNRKKDVGTDATSIHVTRNQQGRSRINTMGKRTFPRPENHRSVKL